MLFEHIPIYTFKIEVSFYMSNSSWLCPYCNHHATITTSQFSSEIHKFNQNNKDGLLGLKTTVVVCPNSQCKEYVITAYLIGYDTSDPMKHVPPMGPTISTWGLKPRTISQIFPDYIPEAIREDYYEACLILNDSPKASAALSRRCLQGIIRDFWKIQKGTLYKEIEELKTKNIEKEILDAIDAVRKIGNIGAHMEKDVNTIIDIAPEEAKKLLELIEVLLKEWYVASYERKERLKGLTKTGDDKEKERKQKTSTTTT